MAVRPPFAEEGKSVFAVAHLEIFLGVKWQERHFGSEESGSSPPFLDFFYFVLQTFTHYTPGISPLTHSA